MLPEKLTVSGIVLMRGHWLSCSRILDCGTRSKKRPCTNTCNASHLVKSVRYVEGKAKICARLWYSDLARRIADIEEVSIPGIIEYRLSGKGSCFWNDNVHLV